MTDTLIMRRATPAEAPRVMDILNDGKRAIARFGIAQWQQGYPNIASVEADLAADACWVAVDAAGALVGTLALHAEPDPEYVSPEIAWLTPNTDADGTPTYLAIHRCATAAGALKRGVMGFMFDEAAQLARAAGRRSLRVDTHPGNVAMRAFLERHGFTQIQEFELKTKGDAETDLTRIAYERLV